MLCEIVKKQKAVIKTNGTKYIEITLFELCPWF